MRPTMRPTTRPTNLPPDATPPNSSRRRIAALCAAAALVAACGGSDDTASDDAADTASDEQPADDTTADVTDDALDDTATEDAMDDTATDDDGIDDTTDDGAGDPGSGSYEPGSVSWRSVNLLDRPVDIYVRTTGLVEAFPIAEGVAPGTVTEYVAPPEEGRYIVTEAGAGDPTCVTQCDHFVAELAAAFGEGPTRTALLYEDSFSGATSLDLSEETESVESAAASGNLLRPADPSTGLVFAIGIALDEDVFGFRVGFEGVDGCVEALDQPNILVGGNQTPVYPYPGDSATIQFFEQPDQECAEPVASFPITGGPGTRQMVILQGGLDAPPTAITLDLSGSVAPDPDAGDSTDEAAGDGIDVAGGREEFVAALLSDAPPGTDEQCVSDVVDQLSDADIEIILANIDAPDLPPGLSPEGLEALSGILDCAPA